LYINSERKLWLAFHVDDFIIMGPSKEELRTFKENLCSHFKIKDLGPVRHFVGMDVVRDFEKGHITISQTGYIEELLDKFGMADAKPMATPLPADVSLVTALPSELLSPTEHSKFRELVGSLNYIAVMTRPDIATAVHQLARFTARPGSTHLVAAKHLLRYLRGTSQKGITYSKSAKDASWFCGCQLGA
jgi:hypothetical protein